MGRLKDERGAAMSRTRKCFQLRASGAALRDSWLLFFHFLEFNRSNTTAQCNRKACSNWRGKERISRKCRSHLAGETLPAPRSGARAAPFNFRTTRSVVDAPYSKKTSSRTPFLDPVLSSSSAAGRLAHAEGVSQSRQRGLRMWSGGIRQSRC